MVWKAKVKIRHLLTAEEDYESVQEAMNNIADVLQDDVHFRGFDISLFRKIPEVADGFFEPVDYANKLINKMYDFADANRIWIE